MNRAMTEDEFYYAIRNTKNFGETLLNGYSFRALYKLEPNYKNVDKIEKIFYFYNLVLPVIAEPYFRMVKGFDRSYRPCLLPKCRKKFRKLLDYLIHQLTDHGHLLPGYGAFLMPQYQTVLTFCFTCKRMFLGSYPLLKHRYPLDSICYYSALLTILKNEDGNFIHNLINFWHSIAYKIWFNLGKNIYKFQDCSLESILNADAEDYELANGDLAYLDEIQNKLSQVSFKHNNKKRELSSYSLCGGEDAAAKKSKLFDPDNDTHVSASDALEYFEDDWFQESELYGPPEFSENFFCKE